MALLSLSVTCSSIVEHSSRALGSPLLDCQAAREVETCSARRLSRMLHCGTFYSLLWVFCEMDAPRRHASTEMTQSSYFLIFGPFTIRVLTARSTVRTQARIPHGKGYIRHSSPGIETAAAHTVAEERPQPRRCQLAQNFSVQPKHASRLTSEPLPRSCKGNLNVGPLSRQSRG